MSDEAALLSAIIAHPDEDTPRLVYADWLDEHGRTEAAECVRVQCRLAAISPADPEWSALIDREEDLIRKGPAHHSPLPLPFHHKDVYVRPYRDEITQFVYRGFPFFASVARSELVAREPAQLADDLTKLVATTTVRSIGFETESVARLAHLIDCPAFDKLRGLAFESPDRYANRSFTTANWKKLLDSPAASRIEQFFVYSALSANVLAAFVSAEAFRGLRRFALPHVDASPAEVRVWLGAGWAQGLRYVQAVLPRAPETAGAIAAGLAGLPQLHALHAAHQTAEQLAHVPAGSFPQLASLRVWGENFTIGHFRALLQAEWVGQLRALDLGGVGDQAISALAKHPVAKELYSLRLYNSSLGKNGLRTIARPGAFPNLIALDLAGCVSTITGKKSATPEEVRAFLSELSLPRVQVLNLSKWHRSLRDDEAKALASNTGLPSLKYLKLEGCHIGADGKKALDESPLGRAAIAYSRT